MRAAEAHRQGREAAAAHDRRLLHADRRRRWTSCFKHWPEALENAVRIGELCNVTFELGKTPTCPSSRCPRATTADSYWRELAEQGLRGALRGLHHASGRKFDPDVYEARLALELGVIEKMGFSGYFLIVWDFIN